MSFLANIEVYLRSTHTVTLLQTLPTHPLCSSLHLGCGWSPCATPAACADCLPLQHRLLSTPLT